jgi:hypothetical protein
MMQDDNRSPLTTDQGGKAGASAPELVNREQEDEDAQAQTLADDAIRGDAMAETESVPSGNAAGIVPEDTQDVVDHMNQMERSGRIDMDAYRGERNDDDEAGSLGPRETDDHVVRLSDE